MQEQISQDKQDANQRVAIDLLDFAKTLLKTDRPNRYLIAAGLCSESVKLFPCPDGILRLSQCLMQIPTHIEIDLSGLPLPSEYKSYQHCPRHEFNVHLARWVLQYSSDNTEALYRLATLISKGVKIVDGDLVVANLPEFSIDRVELETALYERILVLNPKHHQAKFKLRCLRTPLPPPQQIIQSTEVVTMALFNKHQANSFWGTVARNYIEKAKYFLSLDRCDRYTIAAALYAESIKNRLTLEAMLGLHECFQYIPPYVDIDLTKLPLPTGCASYHECSRIEFMENLFRLMLKGVSERNQPQIEQALKELEEGTSVRSLFAKPWF